jgi:predicted RNase H-like HicB family nuclease
MTIRYHVTVSRNRDEWRAVCPALRQHGADIGGETREEALTHIDYAIQMILTVMQMNGVSPPADEPTPDSVVLTFAAEEEAEYYGDQPRHRRHRRRLVRHAAPAAEP